MSGKPWAGRSDAHRRVVATLRRLAPTELEILITGPSGVGKEQYARYAHRESTRASRPFVGVNCGAIPAELVENELFGHVGGAFTGARARADGLVAEAEGGTVFLDEVDTLSPRNQVTLLRFVQEKEYRRLGEPRVRRADVRIIAASNRDLMSAAREGLFRDDLLFRLRVAPIEIPPLRDRPEDAEELWERYADYYAAENAAPRIELSPIALGAIRRHRWPGNVRELENCVRYLTCLRLGRPVEPADLPFAALPDSFVPASNDFRLEGGRVVASANGISGNGYPSNFRAAKAALVSEFERTVVRGALEETRGNIAQAARLVGKPRRAFFCLMRKHQITFNDRG
jgi:two-component system, NtrC family, response regulator GlrR